MATETTDLDPVDPGTPADTVNGASVIGVRTPMELTGRAEALPMVGNNGGLSDLTAALREYGDQATNIPITHLMVAAGTPPSVLDQVRKQGVSLTDSRTEAEELEDLRSDAFSLGWRVFLLVGVLTLLLAFLGVLALAVVQLRWRSYEVAALRVVGVRRRDLRRAIVTEYVALLGMAVVGGALAAVASLLLVLPSLDIGAIGDFDPAVDYQPALACDRRRGGVVCWWSLPASPCGSRAGRSSRARPRPCGRPTPDNRRRHGPPMTQARALPFDPIDEAARQWGLRWDGVPADARGHLADARAAAGDRPARRDPQAARADLRPLRGAGAARLLLARLAAAGQDGRAAAGAPDVGHLDRATGSRPTGSSCARPHPDDGRGGAGRDHRRRARRSSRRRPRDLVGADFALGALERRRARRALRAARARPPGGRRLRGADAVTDSDAVRRVGPRPAADLRACRCAGAGSSRSARSSTSRSRATRSTMGFGFPKAERDGLVASDPETFFLPPACRPALPVGVRPPDRLDDDEMRELVTDAWRMCTPQDAARPARAAGAGHGGVRAAWTRGSGASCGRCCTRTCTSPTARCRCAAAPRCSTTCAEHPTPRPPTEVEVRDGQVYRWIR